MARMRPELSEEQLQGLRSKAEAVFYRACRDLLDHRYLVRFGLPLLRKPPGGRARDGEADFVIFDPRGGFVVIEIKGGGVSYDAVRGTWHSVNREGQSFEINDPFQQAMQRKHDILHLLLEDPRIKVAHTGKLLIGHAAFFPDLVSRQIDRVTLPHAPREIMGGSDDLRRLPLWLESVNAYWADPAAVPFGRAGMTVVEDIFCRPIDVRPMVSALLNDEEAMRIRLTDEQALALRILGHRRRAAISGGAGTGKTLLALQRARELASQGKRTLLLCFNRGLADHLKVVVGKNSNLHPMSFHQLCNWRVECVLRENGIDLLAEARTTYPGADLHGVHLPYALARSTEVSPLRYEAIIVDEGQDFSGDFWMSVEMLLDESPEHTFYVFYDSNQSIYRRSKQFPISDERDSFSLTVNCRNTKHIHEAAYRFYRGERTLASRIVGTEVARITGSSLALQADKVHHAIVELIAREGMGAPDIAVLLAQPGRKKPYYDVLRSKPLPRPAVWSEEAHRQPESVLLDTVSRFKGLEAAIVFLWAIEGLDAESSRELLYVGLSRAKARLYLVGTEIACRSILEAGNAESDVT